MQRINGQSVRLRVNTPKHQNEFLGRMTCIRCGELVPRGSHRPFCLDHAEYAQRLMAVVAAMQTQEAAAPSKRRRRGKIRAA